MCWGVCVGCVLGRVCGVCVGACVEACEGCGGVAGCGSVCGAWGVWGRVGCVWGVQYHPTFFDCEAVTTLAPLYYPDTLVNPDTCLGDYFFKRIIMYECTFEMFQFQSCFV